MKILVVDDHALIRQAMQGVLKKLKRGAVILGAPNCAQALQVVSANPDIDLVLLDLTLPDRDGFVFLGELRERYPKLIIVVLSAVQDPTTVMKSLDLGASGFIPKSTKGEVIFNALRLVLSGGIYVPPEIFSQGELSNFLASKRGDTRSQHVLGTIGLTKRQLDICSLIMQGKNNKTIGRTLRLSQSTVKTHVSKILKKLKVSSRTEAVIVLGNMGAKAPGTDSNDGVPS